MPRPFQDGTPMTGFIVVAFLLPGGQALTLIFYTTFSFGCPIPTGTDLINYSTPLILFGIYDAISENWES